MGCTVTRSTPVENIANGSTAFSRNNSVAEEVDRGSNQAANATHHQNNEDYKPALRIVADFSWLTSNKVISRAETDEER